MSHSGIGCDRGRSSTVSGGSSPEVDLLGGTNPDAGANSPLAVDNLERAAAQHEPSADSDDFAVGRRG